MFERIYDGFIFLKGEKDILYLMLSMAIMFVCTGLLGSLMSLICYHSRPIRQMKQEIMR